jgi:hypothetical protein
MRRIDRKLNMKKVNLLSEQRYLNNKKIINVNEGGPSKLFEVLDDLTDATSIAEWIYKNMDEYLDVNHGYNSGYNLEGRLERLINVIGKKLNIEAFSDYNKVSYKEKTTTNEYDEDSIDGTLYLNGIPVIEYSSLGDGYAFTGDIDIKTLKSWSDKVINKN